MGDHGAKVSKKGFGVESASDDNLVFSSKFNQLKRKLTGTAVTVGANITIPHGLSYNPIFFGLFSVDNSRFKMGFGGADSTNILLDHLGVVTHWRYYIFYHTGV